jgi:hypothetical protein
MRVLADRASLALTTIFVAGLEALTTVTSFYWPLFGAFMFLLVVGTVLTLREDIRTRGVHVLILPLAYVGSVFLFHLFVSHGIFQQLFIILATIGFFFLAARGIEWAFPTWNWFFTSGTFFLFSAGTYGLHFHLRFPLWAVVLIIGGVTFLLSVHVLGRASLPVSRRVFWSTLLTLLMSELLGALALLPVSYLVVSGALFVAFYVTLHLLQRYLYDRLTPRLVSEYLLLGLTAVGLVLGTARWTVL